MSIKYFYSRAESVTDEERIKSELRKMLRDAMKNSDEISNSDKKNASDIPDEVIEILNEFISDFSNEGTIIVGVPKQDGERSRIEEDTLSRIEIPIKKGGEDSDSDDQDEPHIPKEILQMILLEQLRKMSKKGPSIFYDSKHGDEHSGAGEEGYKRLQEELSNIKGLIKDSLQRKAEFSNTQYDKDSVIGLGSNGTIVYKGFYESESRPAAVKRISTHFYKIADREIYALRKLPSKHPNIIQYFATKKIDDYYLIVTELADETLTNLIETNYNTLSTLDKIDIVKQICSGLEYLHKYNVIHRDIKPNNILVSNSDSKRIMMLSDFGVCKIKSGLLNSQTTATTTSSLKGTKGWICPEELIAKASGDKEYRSTTKGDIFSMGSVVYYVLTGHNPFDDDPDDANYKIKRNIKDLSLLESPEKIIYHNLVDSMISPLPENRPAIETVLKHPIFWDVQTQLDFFTDFSNRIETQLKKDPNLQKIYTYLESKRSAILGKDWLSQIKIQELQDILANPEGRGPYNTKSVIDLIRAIRNTKIHYGRYLIRFPSLETSLGSNPSYAMPYFTSLFPRLLISTYIEAQIFKNEEAFYKYYNKNDEFMWKI